jgi:hypothetical protein
VTGSTGGYAYAINKEINIILCDVLLIAYMHCVIKIVPYKLLFSKQYFITRHVCVCVSKSARPCTDDDTENCAVLTGPVCGLSPLSVVLLGGIFI